MSAHYARGKLVQTLRIADAEGKNVEFYATLGSTKSSIHTVPAARSSAKSRRWLAWRPLGTWTKAPAPTVKPETAYLGNCCHACAAPPPRMHKKPLNSGVASVSKSLMAPPSARQTPPKTSAPIPNPAHRNADVVSRS